MSSVLNEWESYQDIDGKPIVNGFVYFGVANSDPTLLVNQIDIFANRALTTPLANPQRTDSFGRTNNKVWLSGAFAKLVEDENNVQIFSDPDAGEEAMALILNLTNVQGNNAITAEGTPAITSYTDKTQYTFIAAGINTTDVTLNIDGVGVTPVRIQHDLELSPGNFVTNQVVQVVYNLDDDIFEVASNVANDGLGTIKLWSGSVATIPIGFQLCDGTNGTPDLRDDFVIGAGSSFNPDDTGGSLITGSHALTVAELAIHNHSYTHVVSQSQNANLDNDVQATAQIAGATTGNAGSGSGHTHTANRPQFNSA